MRGVLLPAILFVAVAATAAVGFLVLRDRAPVAPLPVAGEREDGRDEEVRAPGTPTAPGIRPYETTITLTEDLRDALAGPPEELAREWRRVSRTLERKARWMLENAARAEASPRVRALLVLAVGVHEQDSVALHTMLRDPAPVVRRAAALAIAHRTQGTESESLLEGVDVPIGRPLPREAVLRLQAQLGREKDEATRATLNRVLETS